MNRIKFIWFALLILGGTLFCALDARAQSYALSGFNYDVEAGKVYGTSQTYLDYNLNPYYNAGVDGAIVRYSDPNRTSFTIVASGSADHGYNAIVLTEANVQRGQTYGVLSDHWVQTYYTYYGYSDPYGFAYGFMGNPGSPNPYYGFQQGYPAYLQSEWLYLGRTGVIVGLPNITQLAPEAALPGTSAVVQVIGSLLGEHTGRPPAINVSGSGVTARFNNFLPNGVEIILDIAEDADTGLHDLTILADPHPPNFPTFPGVLSNKMQFRVGDRTPQITGITPPQGNTGDQVSVTITGTGFGASPQVLISETGVQPLQVEPISPTEIRAIFSVADSTYLGTRDVKVKSNGRLGYGFSQGAGNSDTSNAVGFEVLAPTVQILNVQPVLEKYGEQTVTVKVSGLTGQNAKIKLTLQPLSGTGVAQFEDNSTEKLLPNGEHSVKIKGITESSQANNMTIKATPTNATTDLGHQEFTVATITSLIFERVNSDDEALDDNPGNGQPNTAIGQRIYPDNKLPVETTDRSIIRVKATVAPNVSGMKVYFAGFDLDDPAANAAPIDPTLSDGNDNNGNVNNSKSGVFSNPVKGTCLNPVAGAAPLHISTIECAVSSKPPVSNIVSANFKTTMQPGDNFAIAASLTEVYRNAIRVNSTDGGKLVNGTNQALAISGESNSDNVQGIRTKMLTVWRKLHTEVDSMDNVTGNSVEVTVPTGGKAPIANVNINVESAKPFDADRFRDGITNIGGRQFTIVANSATTAPVAPSTVYTASVAIHFTRVTTINNGQTFTLYDDDDFNDDDGTAFDGDEGEVLPAPDTSSTSLIVSTDTPCSDTVTSNCNILAPAYIKPVYDLVGSNKTDFLVNIDVTGDPANSPPPAEIQRTYKFANILNEKSETFWTIYLSSAYQYDQRIDNDPNGSGSAGGVTDALFGNAQGALLFLEPTRSKEITVSWGTPPLSRTYTMAHEIGHIFDGRHNDYPAGGNPVDAGLMAPTVVRTGKLFSDTTLNKMRGGLSSYGTRITHP